MSEAMSARQSLLFQQKREFFEAAPQPPPAILLPIPDTPPGHSSQRLSRFDFPMDTNGRRGSSVPASTSSHSPVPPPKPPRTFAYDIFVSEQNSIVATVQKMTGVNLKEMTIEEKVTKGYWNSEKGMYIMPPELVAAQEEQDRLEQEALQAHQEAQNAQAAADDLPSTSGTSTAEMVSRFETLSLDSQDASLRLPNLERRPTRPEVLEVPEERVVEMKPVNGSNCEILPDGTLSPLSSCESPLVLKSAVDSVETMFQYRLTRTHAFREANSSVKGRKGRKRSQGEEALKKRKNRAQIIRVETLAKIKKRNEEQARILKQMLFDTALIVSISRSQNDDGTYKHSPDITYCFGDFPANSSKCITNIGSIIYPDIQHVTKLRRGKHTVDSCDHSFFVAFTDEMGVRTYAYCVKFEPTYSETEPYYFPSVFAILARTRDPSFYFELAKRALAHISDRARLSNFLSTVHPQEHPRKGGMLIVMERNDIGSYGKRSEIHCSFGCDKKMKAGWSVNDLVRQLHPEWVVAIIAACLAEQRVLITGNNVHDVSRAVNAMDALLRPLEWPFTFVPVLPDSILEICDVPAPYLMGVLRHNLDKLHHLVIEDLGKDEAKNQTDFVLFDIDRGLVNPIPLTIKNNKHFEENEFGRFRNMNEIERETYLRRKNTLSYCKSVGMPRKVAKSLIDQLKGALEREKSDYDIETCTEAMLTWYSTVFGHIKSSGAFSNWDKAAKARLVDKQPHPATREFLELLVETTVFDIWIQRRVTGYNIAKILGDTTRNMIKFMQNMLIYWEITAISDPSAGFLTLSQIKSDGRIILPSEELEIIDVIFLKFCDEFDYKRKKPVKAAFKQLFGRN